MKIRVDEAARNTWLLRVGDGRRSQHNTSELLGRHPFRNTLPEPPMDPKFLKQSAGRLLEQVKYTITTLESMHKHRILTEPDLGVAVNLIDPDAYHAYDEDSVPALDPADKYLAELQIDPPGTKKKSVRPEIHESWLRKTEYMANDLYQPATKYKSQMDTMATFREGSKRKDTAQMRTLEQRLQDIEDSFELVKVTPKHHHSKAGLTVVKSAPVLPDMELYANRYAVIGFEDEPFSASGHAEVDAQKALIKAYMQSFEDEDKRLLGYLLPRKRKRSNNEETPEPEPDTQSFGGGMGEYDWVRNYAFQNEQAQDERNMIFIDGNSSGDTTFLLCSDKIAVHRAAMTKDFVQNQYKPSRVDLTRRALRASEKNERGRRKQDALDIEFEIEPDSEPEEAAEVPESEGATGDATGDATGNEGTEGELDATPSEQAEETAGKEDLASDDDGENSDGSI